MRCRSALLLASLCVGAMGAQTLPNTANLTGPLTIVLRGDIADRSVLNAMEREVESLVAPSSIRVAWISNTNGAQVYEHVAVIRLRGNCRGDAPLSTPVRAQGNTAEPLGQTQVSDGKVLPFATVRCDAVRNLIARELVFRPSYEREDVFGRALGRVVAHELYHVLLRTTSHGTTGLARPVQTSADLVADRDSFAPADERKLSEASSVEATESFSPSGR